MITNFPSEVRIKQEAKRFKKQHPEIKYVEALESAVRRHGFANYEEYRRLLAEQSTNEQLVDIEVFRAELVRRGIDFSVFIPTTTGLKKSILDATGPVRHHFESACFHVYSTQDKGPDHRLRKQAFFVSGSKITPTVVSLYRPRTKKGDPRMWFSKLPLFAQENDRVAIIFDDGEPYLINLSSLTTIETIAGFLDGIAAKQESDAVSLIAELTAIAAKGPIRALSVGDTAVGMAVEHALGIDPNCDKNPDYRNKIEIKSAREREKGRQTRQTLFAQVADWGHAKTKFKSSAAILDKFGYQREKDFKLYCTVSALKPNAQGLSFEVTDDGETLCEVHEVEGVVAAWPISLLMKRLLQKHSETFWIKARSDYDVDKTEIFTLQSVRHTKKPLENQILPLIKEGLITMDHLIKRTETGVVKEKGPLFKVSPEGFKYLFPEPIEYSLL